MTNWRTRPGRRRRPCGSRWPISRPERCSMPRQLNRTMTMNWSRTTCTTTCSAGVPAVWSFPPPTNMTVRDRVTCSGKVTTDWATIGTPYRRRPKTSCPEASWKVARNDEALLTSYPWTPTSTSYQATIYQYVS